MSGVSELVAVSETCCSLRAAGKGPCAALEAPHEICLRPCSHCFPEVQVPQPTSRRSSGSSVFVFSPSTRWLVSSHTRLTLRQISDSPKDNLDWQVAQLVCELVECLPLNVLVELGVVPFIFRVNHPALLTAVRVHPDEPQPPVELLMFFICEQPLFQVHVEHLRFLDFNAEFVLTGRMFFSSSPSRGSTPSATSAS